MPARGVLALVIVTLLGNRRGFPKDVKPPHNPGMTMIGASMLWVGWLGFNAGSALAADASAAIAMAVTQISAATASLVWMETEWVKYGKPSLVGLVTRTIAGLDTDCRCSRNGGLRCARQFRHLENTGSNTVGLRVNQEDEFEGLDITPHGKRGYEIWNVFFCKAGLFRAGESGTEAL
ncbi:MAG: ammonium transporter [Rhodospirillales bacterium]|jgi:ammonia channel protein AmtB|nr:ammonium transporter [Rhodospirillales bacterium]